MELVFVWVLCMSFLNIIPWVYLLFTRPDRLIEDQLSESDAALAQLIQIILQKIDSIEELSEQFRGGNQPLDFGSILGQIIQQKMNPVANDDYMRNDDGTFNGAPKIIEAENSQNDLN